jgi:integrase
MTATVVKLPTAARASSPRRPGLTELNVAKLGKPGDTVWDAGSGGVRGLGIRITPRGARTFVWARMLNGRNVRIALDAVGAISLRKAREIAEGYNAAWARGEDPRVGLQAAQDAAEALRKSKDPGPTLEAAYEAHRARLVAEERRESTLKDYAACWAHVPAKLRAKVVADITTVDIQSVVDKVRNDKSGRSRKNGTKTTKPTGKSTMARKVAVMLSAVLRRAGRVHDNPVAKVAKPAARVKTRRLSVDEIGRMLDVLGERQGQLWPDFVHVALLTGARRGALEAMRWADLDLDACLWTVPATWSKNRKELAIGLPTKAVEVLRARQKARGRSAWVWASRKSKTGHVVNADKPLAALLAEAGITQKISMHDLRRTLGSQLAATGAAAHTITKALGHVSPQSAKAYVHLDTSVARAAVENVFARTKTAMQEDPDGR